MRFRWKASIDPGELPCPTVKLIGTNVYATKRENEVSWFQENPALSLDLINAAAQPCNLAIIDIGGGELRLVDVLLQRGFRFLTVLDLSENALAAARTRIGSEAHKVEWIAADVTTWEPSRQYDIWHDRAAFHFLTELEDRAAYVARLTSALRPGGQAIIGTFALDGPENAAACLCSVTMRRACRRRWAANSRSWSSAGRPTRRRGAQPSRSSSRASRSCGPSVIHVPGCSPMAHVPGPNISIFLEIRLTHGDPRLYCRMKIDDAAARLEALGNPTRLRIYRALVRAGDAGSASASCRASSTSRARRSRITSRR